MYIYIYIYPVPTHSPLSLSLSVSVSQCLCPLHTHSLSLSCAWVGGCCVLWPPRFFAHPRLDRERETETRAELQEESGGARERRGEEEVRSAGGDG